MIQNKGENAVEKKPSKEAVFAKKAVVGDIQTEKGHQSTNTVFQNNTKGKNPRSIGG